MTNEPSKAEESTGAEQASPWTSGAKPSPLPTYQELLDEALVLTFPASDPISLSAALRAEQPITTPKDRTDWTLAPEGCDRGDASGRARMEAEQRTAAGPPGADDEQPSNYPPPRS